MKTYRIGIVGAGFGVRTHLPALVAHPRFEVVALASPSSAERIAAERGIPHAFGSCEAMLDGCDLDVVTITSPPYEHVADVTAALAHGKHVLCEKPFTTSVADAQRLVEAAKRAGVACGIAHEFRFVPELLALHELAVNHHLDPMREIDIARYNGQLRESERLPRRWWFEAGMGGGIAGASLVHLIDLSNHIAGRAPKTVSGVLRTANPRRNDEEGTFESHVDDGAFALIDYGDGLVARLASDSTLTIESFACAVHGEKRTAVASGEGMADLELNAIDDDETSELECKPSPYAKLASVGLDVPPMMELYDELVKQIETGRSALPTFSDGLANQRVLAAIGYGT